MRWYMNLSIKNKIASLFILILVVVLIMIFKVEMKLSAFNKSNGKDIYDSISSLMYILAAIVFIISIVSYFVINKFIVLPINRIKDDLVKINEGKLEHTIIENRSDEIGKLSDNLGQLVKRLSLITDLAESASEGDLEKQLVPSSENDVLSISINAMVDTFRKISSEVKVEINQLASAAAEVNSIIAEFSSSISETAASISETTSTVEEVRKTSEVSNKQSKEAADSAENVLEIADHGKKSVDATLHGIELIKDQMSVIAQNIIRLTEQSKAIGEIIESVNDIAEQSNLLAVNASIEAARAGEQGKSFVIVAQEIKNLAEQSKQATGKVKNLLNDIQNSISQAVLATEKGEKVVSEQTAVAKDTGSAINVLSEALNSVRDVILQTSLTIQEQFVGMDQISTAMEDIKTAGLQNAEGSKQLQESAGMLKDVSQKLEDIISYLKI